MNDPREKFITQFSVSCETEKKLLVYEEMLKKWQNKINLISNSTINEIWERHFFDSAQLIKFIPHGTIKLLDLGSGAGFPGIILSIMGVDEVLLVESDKRKAIFMSEVGRNLGLNIKIINERIENVAPFKVDIITARALSNTKELLFYCKNFIQSSPNLRALFLKGENLAKELEEVKDLSEFYVDKINSYPSLTYKNSKILEITFKA